MIRETVRSNLEAVGRMIPQALELSRLAALEPGPRRDKVTLALADALADAHAASAETFEAIGDVLMSLVIAASRDLRIRVAAKVAQVEWAPHELALSLALDELAVAEPVLARCRALIEDDLLDIAARGGPGHRRLIAARPDVTPRICDAVAAAGESEVLLALLQNAHAALSPATFRICVEAARTQATLHRPLAAREDLPVELVEAVYLVVADELRGEIAARYTVDEASLRRVIGAAAAEAVQAAPNQADADREAAALVRSLKAARSLNAEFVARAGREGRSVLFEHAAAALAEVDAAQLRTAFARQGGWAVALCARACDVPRRDFSALAAGLVRAGSIAQAASSTIERAAAQAYVSHSPQTAADALRRIARAG